MRPHPILHKIKKTASNHQLNAIPSGLAGISASLDYMRAYVEEYKTHPTIRAVAQELTNHLSQKDFSGEIDALYYFVQNCIRYVRDVNGVETVQTPLKTLELKSGDCDDKSTLLAALLQSIGFSTRFHAMGFRRNAINHVLLEVEIDGQWLPLETTEPVKLGWIPPNIRTSIYR